MQWKIRTHKPGSARMVKEFPYYIAWTDAMQEGENFVGLIEYQRKLPGANVQVLWVMAPNLVAQRDAEIAAIGMLNHIRDITASGRVIYSDGVAL